MLLWFIVPRPTDKTYGYLGGKPENKSDCVTSNDIPPLSAGKRDHPHGPPFLLTHCKLKKVPERFTPLGKEDTAGLILQLLTGIKALKGTEFIIIRVCSR